MYIISSQVSNSNYTAGGINKPIKVYQFCSIVYNIDRGETIYVFKTKNLPKEIVSWTSNKYLIFLKRIFDHKPSEPIISTYSASFLSLYLKEISPNKLSDFDITLSLSLYYQQNVRKKEERCNIKNASFIYKNNLSDASPIHDIAIRNVK